MKTILCIVPLIMAVINFPAFADKIVIQGAPVVLEQQGDVYYLPKDYTNTVGYYYVTLGVSKKICYLEAQPALASLDKSMVKVNVNGTEVEWNCYALNDVFFEISP